MVPELYLSRFNRGEDFLYRAVCWLERQTYRAADVVIATNESYRNIAITRGGKDPADVFVVRSAPTTDRFRQVPNGRVNQVRQALPALLPRCDGAAGRGRLRTAVVGQAARRVWPHRLACHVHRCAATRFEAMVGLARELELSDVVDFTGRIPDEDLLRYLSTADVCLSPDPLNPLNDVSTMNKIMEYMAMARPIVSFELREARVSAGMPQSTPPPTTSPSLPSGVAYLLDDPDTRRQMGDLGRERVAARAVVGALEGITIAAYHAAMTKNQTLSTEEAGGTGADRELASPPQRTWSSPWKRVINRSSDRTAR